MIAALLALACRGVRAAADTVPAEDHSDPARRHGPAGAGRRLRGWNPSTPPRSEAPPVVMPAKGPQQKVNRRLKKASKMYEEGEYKSAAAKTASDCAQPRDRIRSATRPRAHKYLAFINCRTGREKSCRDEFKKALDADPKFDLGRLPKLDIQSGVRLLRSVKAETRRQGRIAPPRQNRNERSRSVGLPQPPRLTLHGPPPAAAMIQKR